jgi:hypothetical protein
MISGVTCEPLLHRIRAEFMEMPGLRLTSAQAARLWHLDRDTVAVLLAALVEARFLYLTPAGAYKRVESW